MNRPKSGIPEISVVIPCLNEADSIGYCVEQAMDAFTHHGIEGEVVVSDNGSTDESVEIATALGARIVHCKERGYGNALMAGIAQAHAPFIVMGDADGSYDFNEIPNFLTKLRQGFDLVQGCRLPSGGGTVTPGAMPFLHRWIGNPALSFVAQMMFSVPIHDIYCGMRGFSKELYLSLNQRCTGMEFAVEMIIKATLKNAKITETPITLHPDRRISHAPHLRTFRDGWRTVRFFLLSSPKWVYVLPGMTLICLGIIGYALALPGTEILGVTLDVHTLLLASLQIICGYQAIFFGLIAKTFAITEGLLFPDPMLDSFFQKVQLEHGLIVGFVLALVGFCLIVYVLSLWVFSGFGPLD
jgi:glycosyltransferase involved in cell wall biosynthesis